MKYSKLKDVLQEEPGYRLSQAEHAIYKELIEDWAQATSLPIKLREELNKKIPLKIEARTQEKKDSVKAVVRLSDGYTVEAVLLKHGQRNTVCVSSQVGCGMACIFCHSGKLDFKRNLDAEEITAQVLYFSRLLKRPRQSVDNVVFMGMGEPFLNFENVISSIKILNSRDKFDISARKISVSTSGVVGRIKDFSHIGFQANLAVSLNAPNDALRSKIMPIDKKYPLKILMEAVNYYTRQTNRKVMFEYVLIDGLNDRPEHAKELAALLKGKLCMVNLIPYNGDDIFKPASVSATAKFIQILRQRNIEVIQRQRFGKGIDAACGQLVYRTYDPKV